MTTKNTTKSITDFLKARGEVYVSGAKNVTHAVEFWLEWDDDEDTDNFEWDDEEAMPEETPTPFKLACFRCNLATGEPTCETVCFQTLREAQGYMKRFIRWYMPRSSHRPVTFDHWQLQ